MGTWCGFLFFSFSSIVKYINIYIYIYLSIEITSSRLNEYKRESREKAHLVKEEEEKKEFSPRARTLQTKTYILHQIC